MQRLITLILLNSLLCFGAVSAAADTTGTPFLLGVFPYLPPARLEQLYAPVAADLSRAIGRPVQLRTRPDFRSFSEGIKNESYDLIFIQPFAYAQLAVRHGYQALARPRHPLSAIVVTPKESAIRSLDDLRGKKIATPPQSAAVSILGLQMLSGHNLRPGNDVQLVHRKSHIACMRMALIGKASACITARSPLMVLTQNSGIRFRVIATSDPVPASTFAIHRRVSPSTRNLLLRQILSWDKHPSGRELLGTLHQGPYTVSLDKDYDPVRKILDDTKASREALEDYEPSHH